MKKQINTKEMMKIYEEFVDNEQNIKSYEIIGGIRNQMASRIASKMECYRQRREELIKILDESCEKLTTEIKAVEGRSTARLLTAIDVLAMIKKVEKHLGITKRALEGVSFTADVNAHDFPRAYKYTPESTHFSAIFKNGSWRICDIDRKRCDRRKCIISLTDAAKSEILYNAARI